MSKKITITASLLFSIVALSCAKADQGVTAHAVINCDNFLCQVYCDASGKEAFNTYCADFSGVQQEWCLNSENKNTGYAQACADNCNCGDVKNRNNSK